MTVLFNGILFNGPRDKPLSAAGAIQPFCYRCFFSTGTTNPANVYSAGSPLSGVLTQPAPGQVNPVGFGTQAASDGRFAPIYMDPATTYRVQLYTQGGALLEDTDPYSVSGLPTANGLGAILFPQTAAELNGGITPTNYVYQPGDLRRYGGVGDGGTANDTPLASASAQSNQIGGSPVIVLAGTYNITLSATIGAFGVFSDGSGKISIANAKVLAINGPAFTPNPAPGALFTGLGTIAGFGAWQITVLSSGLHEVYEPNFSIAAQAPVATYSSGTFSVTYVGAALGNTTVNYVRVGNLVMLTFPAQLAAGTGTSFSCSVLPAALRPVTVSDIMVPIGGLEDNSVVAGLGMADINSSAGVINFLKNSGAAWVAGGSRGFTNPVTVCYTIQ